MTIVLDADGVFLRERPYWRTALATALSLLGAHDVDEPKFRALDAELFDVRSLQRIGKDAGFNSNWDLCGALVCCLDESTRRDEWLPALHRNDISRAAAGWCDALQDYVDRLATKRDEAGSLVAALRAEPAFKPVIPRFQQIFHGQDQRFDVRPQYETLGDPVSVRRAFRRLRETGATLGICTGRNRREIREPLARFGLLDEALERNIVSCDEVERAEAATAAPALLKPHWFPLAAVVAGVQAAIDALRDGTRLPPQCGRAAVFVGDSLADFGTAANYQKRGGHVRFVLVNSGSLSAESVRKLGEDPLTLSVVDSFEQVSDVLAEARP
jgi:phosphoglycolate phosphatase-like HAD superfamily hydrolase